MGGCGTIAGEPAEEAIPVNHGVWGGMLCTIRLSVALCFLLCLHAAAHACEVTVQSCGTLVSRALLMCHGSVWKVLFFPLLT